MYMVFFKYCVFSLTFCDFSELCAHVLPAWRVYTHWHQEKTEKDQSPEYSKTLEKKHNINEHPVDLLHSVNVRRGMGSSELKKAFFSGRP